MLSIWTNLKYLLFGKELKFFVLWRVKWLSTFVVWVPFWMVRAYLIQSKICSVQKKSLFYQLVVNMGKYIPKKGKVSKNNKCHKAQVIFRLY